MVPQLHSGETFSLNRNIHMWFVQTCFLCLALLTEIFLFNVVVQVLLGSRLLIGQGEYIVIWNSNIQSDLALHNKPYLVWPIRCTRPTACSSWAGFKAGSTNSTCVASMMFSPLEPVWSGKRSTPTIASCLNVCRFVWELTRCQDGYKWKPV